MIFFSLRLALATTYLTLCLALLVSGPIQAAEPNNTFAEATVLASGVLTVSDDLTPGESGFAPDTLLIALDQFGEIIDETFDDDDSIFGDGTASGFTDVDVNPSGEIAFAITGFGDDFFEGDHEQEGGYETFVEVYSSLGSLVSEISFNAYLDFGAVDEHHFSDPLWDGGTYTVNIDNDIGGITDGDVDFFTFTGLTPGEAFSAETVSGTSIDTFLGWYSDNGTLLETDDDAGLGFLSRIEDIVPASGKLTFAVTGHGDNGFVGAHSQEDIYDLQLTTNAAGFSADFDGNGRVDGADLTHPTLGWHARYGSDLDGADFLEWQQQFGSGVGSLATSEAVPVPTSSALLLIAALVSTPFRMCRRTAKIL